MRTFIDTSVFIARHAHSRQHAARVELTTGEASGCTKVSGLVVRQEIRRRLLGTAEYLHRQLDERNGYDNVYHHMIRLAGNPHESHRRRAAICLALMKDIPGEDDSEKTDRLKTKLRTLILTCLAKFDRWLDHLERGSGCCCATFDPVERKKRGGRVIFEMGDNKCGTDGRCQVGKFLTAMTSSTAAIHSHLAIALGPDDREELRNILAFLNDGAVPGFVATDRNPCLTVGDLLIALESVAANCGEMYTMNHRDSLPLCTALGQRLRILSHESEIADSVVSPTPSTPQ